jgi:hypothetical protein
MPNIFNKQDYEVLNDNRNENKKIIEIEEIIDDHKQNYMKDHRKDSMQSNPFD